MKDSEINKIVEVVDKSEFWSKSTILVVDDMESVRQQMREILNPLNFKNIFEAANGKEALTIIKQSLSSGNKIDVIISDINMPICGGIELLHKCKTSESTKGIPFLIISTENESEIVLKAISLGAANYIIKPFDHKTIKRKLYDLFKSSI